MNIYIFMNVFTCTNVDTSMHMYEYIGDYEYISIYMYEQAKNILWAEEIQALKVETLVLCSAADKVVPSKEVIRYVLVIFLFAV
jgi:hypothetical protein